MIKAANNKDADQTARMLFAYEINRFIHDMAHFGGDGHDDQSSCV